jgi:hypothetical protein
MGKGTRKLELTLTRGKSRVQDVNVYADVNIVIPDSVFDHVYDARSTYSINISGSYGVEAAAAVVRHIV